MCLSLLRYHLRSFKRHKAKVKSLRCVRLFATPWTVAYQVPLSIGFSRQEFRSGLPVPSPGDIPNPGINPGSRTFQADSLPSKPTGKYVLLFASLWTLTCQVPLSIGFSRQEYWSGLPFPPLGDLPDPRMEPVSPALAGKF